MKNNNRSLKQTYLTSLSQLSDGISYGIDVYIDIANNDISKLESKTKDYIKNTTQIEENSQNKDLEEEILTTLDSLKSQVKNIARLKHYFKYKTETTKKNKNSFKLGDVVNRIKLLTSDELKENNCILDIKLKTPNDTKIKGRATSLVQVLLIHIVNACHAYQKNNGKIHLIISQDENLNTTIQIHDHAEKSNKFHENFIKTDIYMSYMIVKNEFDGVVWFESEDNGTSFFITIPK